VKTFSLVQNYNLQDLGSGLQPLLASDVLYGWFSFRSTDAEMSHYAVAKAEWTRSFKIA